MEIKNISFANFLDRWVIIFEYENDKKEVYDLNGTMYGSLNKNQIEDVLGE